MMHFKITVITPSYNQGRFIQRTIESVLSQQFSGTLEYLVMDGGSQDETVDILRSYGTRLAWVSEIDRGQTDAVNKGLLRARGDVIGWLNSDDIYYPGAIQAACNAFEADPSLDVIYGDANHIDENDRVMEPYPTEEVNLSRLTNTCYICQPAVFFRRSVVDRFGTLDATLQFCMDYEYWVRLTAAGANFLWLRRVLAGSRLYAENKTLGERVKVHAEINNMLRQHARRVPDQWLFSYAHAVLDDKGVSRSDPIRFPSLVALLSIASALRWNRRISPQMVSTVGTWGRSAFQEILKRLSSR